MRSNVEVRTEWPKHRSTRSIKIFIKTLRNNYHTRTNSTLKMLALETLLIGTDGVNKTRTREWKNQMKERTSRFLKVSRAAPTKKFGRFAATYVSTATLGGSLLLWTLASHL